MMMYLATQRWGNQWVNHHSQGAVRIRQQLGSHSDEARYLRGLPLNQPELRRAQPCLRLLPHLLWLLRSWGSGRLRGRGGRGGLGRHWERNGCGLRLRGWNGLGQRLLIVPLVQLKHLILSYVKILPCTAKTEKVGGRGEQRVSPVTDLMSQRLFV